MVLAMGPHDDQKAGELDRLDYHSVNCKYLKQRHRRAIFGGNATRSVAKPVAPDEASIHAGRRGFQSRHTICEKLSRHEQRAGQHRPYIQNELQ